MTLPTGTRLGAYEILGSLGAGGMGEVYRAHDPRLDRDVAVKVLPQELSNDSDRLRRFEQEARAAGALSHPNILAVHDFGTHDGAPYVVSELLEGESLRSVLREGGLTARKAIDYAVQIAQGMAAAHEKGIVHRDLKPENLFLTRDGRVKILDFGLAKLRDPVGLQAAPETGTATWTTASGIVLGTVGYMSPEQVRGVPADHRSDIFSFGAVLYEMLARRRAFQRETAAETLTAILKEDPADLDGTDAHITPGLQRILRRCLEKRPEDRFQSARDLAFALGSLSGSSPRSGASALQGPAAVASRRGWVLALATVVALAGLGAGLWRLGRADAVWENPLSGARFTRFTDFEGSEVDASLSSDGKFVVFLSDRAGPFDAWVSQVGSGEFVNLTNGRFPQLFNEAVRNVGFSEDGAHVWIQVVGKTPTDHSVWLIPTMGGSPRPLLPTAVSAAWSPRLLGV